MFHKFKRISLLYLACIAAIGCLYVSGASAQGNQGTVWTDAKSLTLEGKGWTDTPGPYNRMPTKSVGKISDGVTWLATNSSGMVIRFITNSPNIQVKWKLTSDNLAMNHMASTGVSGVDLYLRYKGKWQWAAIGRPSGIENSATLLSGQPNENREYSLYLPLYNGVESVEIGTDASAAIKPAGPRTNNAKPVVFYGTSITQGGCAARPGMAYSAIIGRNLDVQTINLGFSGNGRAEHAMSDTLAELDPSVYVIACMENMDDDQVDGRIRYMLSVLHAKHPTTPVVLVENIIFQNEYIWNPKPGSNPRNIALAKIYKDEAKNWNGNLYYVKCDKLTGNDGEATVDGVHPTDLGFSRMAKELTPVIKKALSKTRKQ